MAKVRVETQGLRKMATCEGCGKDFDVSHVLYGVEQCPHCGYLNWLEFPGGE